jgi:hypothetical protein
MMQSVIASHRRRHGVHFLEPVALRGALLATLLAGAEAQLPPFPQLVEASFENYMKQASNPVLVRARIWVAWVVAVISVIGTAHFCKKRINQSMVRRM